jgi:hypothetical protein
MKRAISAWLHKFSEAAEKALTAEFLRQDLKTDAKKAEFVRFLLGDVNDISSKNIRKLAKILMQSDAI